MSLSRPDSTSPMQFISKTRRLSSFRQSRNPSSDVSGGTEEEISRRDGPDAPNICSGGEPRSVGGRALFEDMALAARAAETLEKRCGPPVPSC